MEIPPEAQRRLFCFGLGYSATRLARALIADSWSVAGTCRSPDAVTDLRVDGIDADLFDGEVAMDRIGDALAGATHLLHSIPPGEAGDPVLRLHGPDIARCAGLQWATGDRGQRRAGAERAWFDLFEHRDAAAHVFRLAGIYGPGRSALDTARQGARPRIIKPGHVFSRIHVDDIGTVLRASMARPNPGAIYNVCDDRPAPSSDVTAFACELLGIAPPPEILFEDADLSPMARSFYADNRRVRNDRIRDELGVELAYPDFETGLRAILAGRAN